MSDDAVLVIGSGPSGVHAAWTLLERGRRVRLLDVGFAPAAPVSPELDLNGLKARLPDPTRYFLGNDWSALVLPGEGGEYYGFPPSKDYVFAPAPGFGWRGEGFEPLFSFGQGGLAEAWTGGCYPFEARELADWPFGLDTLLPFYGRVAERIGISGTAQDDLQERFPDHAGLQPPLELDGHGAELLARYQARRDAIRGQLQCVVGRSRSAVLSRPLGDRPACHYSGRCLWGCPTEAFYTPSVTLRACLRREGFDYLPGWLALRLRSDGSGRVREVVARSVRDGREERFAAAGVVVAAGALASARILLETARAESGGAPELCGLMDNRQVMAPFVNLRRVGRAFEPESYQYHQLAIGYDPGGARDYVHGLVTTLTTALVHPVVQALPLSMGNALPVFRALHGALGLLNVNFADWRRDTNRVALEPAPDGGSRLLLHYAPEPGEPPRVRRALRTLRRLLLRLGCVAPAPMARLRPMGSSVHYAGLVPMCEDGGDFTATPEGRWRAFDNVWLADGITFPSLPAKNLTFTLMANATRIAEGLP